MRNPLVLAVALVLLALAAPVQAQETPAPAQETPAPTNPAFEEMKTLVGEWQATVGGEQIRNSFRLVGGGTVLMHVETIPGDSDVVTMFYPVGGEVRADHYCAYRNQPRFTAKPSADLSVIRFEFREITNLSAPSAVYMHGTDWRFPDSDHLVQEWHGFKDGKEKGIIRLEFKRLKP